MCCIFASYDRYGLCACKMQALPSGFSLILPAVGKEQHAGPGLICGSRGEKGADFMAWRAEQRSECVSVPGLAAGHIIAPELVIRQILHKMLHQKHKGNTPPAHPSWDQDRNRQLALQSAVEGLTALQCNIKSGNARTNCKLKAAEARKHSRLHGRSDVDQAQAQAQAQAHPPSRPPTHIHKTVCSPELVPQCDLETSTRL